MRPTDVCHPYDLRAPASRAFPASSPDFHRVDTPQSLRLYAVVTGGPKGSRPSRPLRRIVPHTTPTLFAFNVCLVRSASRLSGHERGRFLPTVRRPIEPLTSLSPLPVHHHVARHFRACFFVRRPVGRSHEVWLMGKLPRSLSTPARDDECFQQPGMPSLGGDPS